LENAAATLQVVCDGREGLVDLMGEGGGHLAERSEPRHVHEFRLELLQARLGLLPLREITDESGEISLATRACFSHSQFNGKGGPILALPHDDTADANDAPLTCREVTVHVAVVLLTIGAG